LFFIELFAVDFFATFPVTDFWVLDVRREEGLRRADEEREVIWFEPVCAFRPEAAAGWRGINL
jgi:hypothetical protein